MSTAPWSADTPELLTADLTHIARARLVMPDGEIVPLELETGSVSFDETRAPRVTANLSCRVPTDAALLGRIDPRTGARLIVEAGYLRPGGVEDVQTLVDLGLRDRQVSRPDDRMALEGASDEAIVIDNAPSATLTVNTATTTAGITYILGLVLASPTVTITAPTGPAVNQTDPAGDKWSTMADLADRIEARVFDNGLREWRVEPAPVLAEPVVQLKVGDGGTVTATDSVLSRDGFANRVFLTYEWHDAGGTRQRVVSVRSVTSGPYAAVLGNVLTHDERRDVPATQTQADAAATALVKRTVTRGRSFSLRAVSAYWLRPGHTAAITPVLGDPEGHLVTAVSFDLATGLMNVQTRLPDNAGTIGA